jgi:hypothetical protein
VSRAGGIPVVHGGEDVNYRYWPLFDLRLATPGLALRPMTEADLAVLADLLPDDVE